MRENRPYGGTWRGLETWPRGKGEPTLPSKEPDWKPSTYSRRACPRPYLNGEDEGIDMRKLRHYALSLPNLHTVQRRE
jgi:hypothetical protein